VTKQQYVVVTTPGHGEPRMKHFSDCPHLTDDVTTTRRATPQEVASLRTCTDCASKERRDA
jgi:hypothetical protein